MSPPPEGRSLFEMDGVNRARRNMILYKKFIFYDFALSFVPSGLANLIFFYIFVTYSPIL